MQSRSRLLAFACFVALAAAGATWLVLRVRPVSDRPAPHAEVRTPPSPTAGEAAASPEEPGRTARLRERMLRPEPGGEEDVLAEAADRNAAANELFALPELPDGLVADLARTFASPDENEVWRDYCLQFLGSALERADGVTDADRALARATLVGALDSAGATFAGTALRALHRGNPSDPLVASSALRIARDPSYPSSSRTTALLILEECALGPTDASVLLETAESIARDASAPALLRGSAGAVLSRSGR